MNRRGATCLLWLLPAMAQAQFDCTTNDGAITITHYRGSGGEVTIPATISGLPVVAVGGGAFANNRTLTGITIPDTVTNIGNNAFYCVGSPSRLTRVALGTGVVSIGNFAFSACNQLTGITIPQSAVSIGTGAFVFCTSLTNVTIPSGVTHIGERAFNACFKLPDITVDSSNPVYTSVEGVLFDRQRTTLLQFPGGKGGSYEIPDGVTNLAHLALWNCPRLTSLTIPDGVIHIGDEAFAACNHLARVTIPVSVANIGTGAFNSCVSLTGVFFRGNPPNLARSVFTGDDQATVYYLPGTTGWGPTFGGRPTAVWKP
jgi:hypothetical protein